MEMEMERYDFHLINQMDGWMDGWMDALPIEQEWMERHSCHSLNL